MDHIIASLLRADENCLRLSLATAGNLIDEIYVTQTLIKSGATVPAWQLAEKYQLIESACLITRLLDCNNIAVLKWAIMRGYPIDYDDVARIIELKDYALLNKIPVRYFTEYVAATFPPSGSNIALRQNIRSARPRQFSEQTYYEATERISVFVGLTVTFNCVFPESLISRLLRHDRIAALKWMLETYPLYEVSDDHVSAAFSRDSAAISVGVAATVYEQFQLNRKHWLSLAAKYDRPDLSQWLELAVII